MTEFTPLTSTLGGILIGLAAVFFMIANGRVAGISGIASRLLPPYEDRDTASRAAFVAGLIAAPLVYLALGGAIVQTVSTNIPLLALAGLLVGFGSVYGGGCTSGHGVCGIARISKRSLVATATFMAVAMLTVFVARHVL
jgi:uncharacterized membrane protein YedE/YeeE